MKSKLGIVTLVDIDRVSVVPGGSTGAVRNIQVSGDPSLLKPGDQVMLDYVDGRMLAFPIYQPTPASEAASAAAEDAVREEGVSDKGTGITNILGRGSDHPYKFTFRQFLSNSFANGMAGFDDAQASPYSFGGTPGGFTISAPAGITANSTSMRSYLTVSKTSTPAFTLDWASATAATRYEIMLWIAEETNAASYYHSELRFWADQVPTASSKYWALRWKWITGTPGSIGLYYYYGTGVTFADADGTLLAGPSNISPGFLYDYYTSHTTETFRWWARVSEGGIAANKTYTASGWPSNFKCARYYIPAGNAQYIGIDSIRIS